MKKLKIFSLSAFCSLSLFSCSFFNNLFSNGNGGSNGRIDQLSVAEIDLDVRDKNPIHAALKDFPTEDREKFKQYFKDDCLSNNFVQGQDENLYGIHCLKNNRLSIKTSKDGTKVATSSALMFESTLNKEIYKTEYEIIETEDFRLNPLLSKLLRPLEAAQQEFIGMLNTEYQILFDFRDDWLILYKASEREELIPFTERSSEEPSLRNSGLYAVPFIGYKVQYCDVKQREINGEKTNEYIKTACDARLKTASTDKEKPYVQIIGTQQVYQYVPKLDLLPSNYFDGRWFFTRAVVKSASDLKEMLYTDNAYLVEATKGEDSLHFMDKSGDVEEAVQDRKYKLHIKWKKYKMDANFQEKEEAISKLIEEIELAENNTNKPENETEMSTEPAAKDGEKTNTAPEESEEIREVKIRAPYLLVDFDNLLEENKELKELFVSDNFFSYVIERSSGNKKEQTKYSFLRESSLDKSGFQAKRWHKSNHEKYFGVLPAWPQEDGDVLDNDESRFSHFKQFQFNTNGGDQTIRWHFSKNSTTDLFYRDIAREAVNIYHQAFQHISNGKIKVILVESEDKNLGDLRYNLINLLDRKSYYPGSSLFGVAPSFSNPDTGQTIGSVANVAIHTTVDEFDLKVKKYIQYEIFRKHKKTDWENDLHAVSPYLKTQIESQCRGNDESNKRGEILHFIDQHITLRDQGKITPRSPLGRDLGYNEDNVKDLISNCSKKISRNYILMLLLHEMGHNFGLAHNFKASADKDNYWKSKSDISTVFDTNSLSLILDENSHLSDDERLPKSSSVMDYLPLDVLPLTYLGKYDIAALRFIYMGELEKKDDSQPIKITDFSSSLETKIHSGVLEIDNFKRYMHCSKDLGGSQNWQTKEDLLCAKNDYGASILERVQFFIANFRRLLYNGRYHYDTHDREVENLQINGVGNKLRPVNLLEPIYKRWIELRNDFLKSQNNPYVDRYKISEHHRHKTVIETMETIDALDNYKNEILGCRAEVENGLSVSVGNKGVVHQNPSVLSYLETIDRGLTESHDIEEYQAFYAIRRPIANFFMELLFLEPMKCQVQKTSGFTQYVELEMVRKYLRNPDSNQWDELQNKYAHLSSEEDPFIYIEDCYSPAVKDFFKANNLQVIGQVGLEGFSSFYPNEHSIKSKKNDVVNFNGIISQLDNLWIFGNPPATSYISRFIYEEPDFFEEFRIKAEDHILQLKNVGLLPKFYTIMISHLNIQNNANPHDKSIREANLNYFKSLIYSPTSFLGIENIIREFGVKSSVLTTDHPFIQESYNDFIDSLNLSANDENICLNQPADPVICQSGSFESHIRSLQISAENLGTGLSNHFAIPFKSDNLTEQMIEMYNCKMSERESLIGQELSDLEKIQKDSLDLHISVLRNVLRSGRITARDNPPWPRR